MMNNILAESIRPCTGCGACSSACSTNAISIIENNEGFFSPIVDNSKCINCGSCKRVCYKYSALDRQSRTESCLCYATYSCNNHTHATTTSGGFAYEISRWGIENGYRIMGVVYDYDSHKARTIIVDNITELEKLKGSKYLQSYTEKAFKEFIDNCRINPTQKYICIGTPCQIFGLHSLSKIKGVNNKIIYVDLFCHGVPSYLVWNPYIKEQQSRLGNIKDINFRYKGNGWHNYSIGIVGSKDSYINYAYNDIFYRYFFDNVVLNTSCYTCALRKDIACCASDIRIGDFLGAAYENREDGISAAIALTDNGTECIENLISNGYIHVVKTHPISDCIKAQSTEDYNIINIRHEVINRLHKNNLLQVKKWYTRQFPQSQRLYLILKSFATLLPIGTLKRIRRTIRSLKR